MKKLICILLVAVLLVAGCGTSTLEEEIVAVDSPLAALKTTQQRREAAESYMRYMMSMLWQVEASMDYSYKVGSGDVTIDRSSYIGELEAGKIYSGLPYTHGSGDGESFALYGEMMENGVLRMDKLTPALLNGSGGMTKVNNTARIGNDCADAVFAAWTRAGSTVTFANAANMTPKFGCIPVGDYKTVGEDVADYPITGDICKENGEDVMFAAYGKLQMADGLSVNTKGGAHAMLVAEVHTVMDGDKIDPEESYVLVHEQTGKYFQAGETRWDESVGQEVYVMGGVDRKYTFRKLFKAGYLPVTCKEFIDETPLPAEEVTDSEAELTLDGDSLFTGAFISNYRIASVRVEILDSTGMIVQQATCCAGGGERNLFLLSRFEAEMEQPVLAGGINWAQMKKGQKYTARFTCRLSTGLEVVSREFTFTY